MWYSVVYEMFEMLLVEIIMHYLEEVEATRLFQIASSSYVHNMQVVSMAIICILYDIRANKKYKQKL